MEKFRLKQAESNGTCAATATLTTTAASTTSDTITK